MRLRVFLLVTVLLLASVSATVAQQYKLRMQLCACAGNGKRYPHIKSVDIVIKGIAQKRK